MTEFQTLHLRIINQVFELDKKIQQKADIASLNRHTDRIKSALEELGYRIQNPVGEPYSDTRTDYEASIVGAKMQQLTIVETIKPIVYYQEKNNSSVELLQMGVVIVEGK